MSTEVVIITRESSGVTNTPINVSTSSWTGRIPKESRNVVSGSSRSNLNSSPNEPLVAVVASAPIPFDSQGLVLETILSAPLLVRRTFSACSNGMNNILEELREFYQRLQGVPEAMTGEIRLRL